jgi:hypothetical protein
VAGINREKSMSHVNRFTVLAFGVCAAVSLGCDTSGSGSESGSGGMGGEGGAAGEPLDQTFKAATCIREITPVSPNLASAYQEAFGEAGAVNHSDPIYMAGFGTREATGYHDRLWARGLVMGGPGGRVAMVALDVVGYFQNETQTIRAMVAEESGIDHAVISSTHQHEGPDTLGIYGPSEIITGIDFAYLDFVNAAVADCIDEAAANLEEARLRTLTTNSNGLSLGLDPRDDELGVADGKVLEGDMDLAPDTEGRIVNASLPVLQVTKREPGEGGEYEVLGTLVNFASHPESLGSDNTLITSDFPHYVRERLEEEYGGLAIFVSADLGVLQGPLWIDVEDPVTEMPAVRRTYRFAEVHGAQLAERIIENIDPMAAGDDGPEIRFAMTSPVAIPLANPYFRVAAALESLNKRRSLYTNGEPDKSFVKPYDAPYDWIPLAAGEDLYTEVSALRIGDASFAVVPTELDPQLGDGYRDAMTGAEHRFLIGLGNDHIGYQVPFDKWDNSCHACFPDEALCGVEPDCNTVFENNVGQQVDPMVSAPLLELIDALH